MKGEFQWGISMCIKNAFTPSKPNSGVKQTKGPQCEDSQPNQQIHVLVCV